MLDPSRPDRDPQRLHPLLWGRWQNLRPVLVQRLGCDLLLWEGYRSNARQQWLFGSGRTAAQCLEKRVPVEFARPTEKVVTNAWSAATSAHGWLVDWRPASCAIDVVPLGADGKPWTTDDPWQKFSDLTDEPLDELVRQHGLTHFRAAGKQVWDKPHLQLVEWSDAQRKLLL